MNEETAECQAEDLISGGNFFEWGRHHISVPKNSIRSSKILLNGLDLFPLFPRFLSYLSLLSLF